MIVLFIAAALAIGQQSASDLDDFAEQLIERLIAAEATGIVRVLAGPDNTLLFSGVTAEGIDSFDIYRRLPGEGFRSYRRVAAIPANVLEQPSQEVTNGTLQVGDLLVHRGSRIGLAVRLVPFENLRNPAAEMLGRLIRIRLERIGLFQVGELQGIDSTGKLILDNMNELRERLRDQGIAAALNLLPIRSAGGITIICQLISGTPEGDDLFSFGPVMSPELTVLLQSGAGEEPAPGTGSKLIASAPLAKDVLAIAAVDADGREGDELALLLPREVQMFRWSDDRLSLFLRIALDSIPAAEYPTRLPSGHLFTADINGDGKRELLASSNLWAAGCIIEFNDDAVVTMLSQQPLAAFGNNEDLLYYLGSYRPGEDTYRDVVRILNNRGQTVRQSLFENLRSLHSLDDNGNRIIILHTDWRGSLWDRGKEDISVTPLNFGRVAALTASLDKAVLAQFRNEAVRSGGESVTSTAADGVIIRIVDLDGVEQEKTIHLTTVLDIVGVTVYNPPGFPVRALAFLAKDNLGSISLDLYSWPE